MLKALYEAKNEKKTNIELAKIASTIEIKKVKSPIGRNSKQRKILISLGLNKINREKIVDENPAIQGMIEKVKHLIVFEKE